MWRKDCLFLLLKAVRRYNDVISTRWSVLSLTVIHIPPFPRNLIMFLVSCRHCRQCPCDQMHPVIVVSHSHRSRSSCAGQRFSQVMVNGADDRWVTESGFGTAGNAFMYLIKALLSRRRDRWRRLGYGSLGKSAASPRQLPSSMFFLFSTSHARLRTGGVLAWVHIDARKRRPKLIKYWKWGLCSERWSHGTCLQSQDGK